MNASPYIGDVGDDFICKEYLEIKRRKEKKERREKSIPNIPNSSPSKVR
jgi:hypothetical protein